MLREQEDLLEARFMEIMTSMKSYHFSKEEFRNILSIIHLVAWNKMCHFTKAIHYHKNGIKTFCGPRKS